MLSKNEFELLAGFKTGLTKVQIEQKSGISEEDFSALVLRLKSAGLIDKNNNLTPNAETQLEYYKVDNAIIMAAGMSSRFAPLSYEKPKGLIEVKGEILIERQIKQLLSAGIDDITVVVGYMKERFFYLQEKFGVDIVINDDYYRYNNTSTLIRVKEKLKNTYICSSDNYFTENVFEKYVYDSYYSAVYLAGKSDEYGIDYNEQGLITSVNHTPFDSWVMLGHVYFSKAFSEKFVDILQSEYELGNTKNELWEKLLERHLDELKIYIKKYSDNVILEFDCLEDLRNFDSKYLVNSDSEIFDNICRVLGCKESEIKDISVLSQGLTNSSFKFTVNGKEYIYDCEKNKIGII